MLKWRRGRTGNSGSIDDTQHSSSSIDRICEQSERSEKTSGIDDEAKRGRKSSATANLRSSMSCPDINEALAAQSNGVKTVEIDIDDPTITNHERGMSDLAEVGYKNEDTNNAPVRHKQSVTSRASWMQVVDSGEQAAHSAVETEAESVEVSNSMQVRISVDGDNSTGTSEAVLMGEAQQQPQQQHQDVLAEFLAEPCVPPGLPSDLKEYITRIDRTYTTDTKATEFRLESALYEYLEKEVHYGYLVRMTRAFLVDRLINDARLSVEQVERVFPRICLDNLVRIHCPIARILRVEFLENMSATNRMHIGDYSLVLLEHFHTNELSLIETYGRLTANQEAAQAEYKLWVADKKQDRATALNALRSMAVCERQGVNELLLLFTQRLTKYPALFEAIIKQSEKIAPKLTSVAEKQHLEEQVGRWKQLLELSEGILKKVDLLKPEFENETKLAQLRLRFDPRIVALYDRPTATPLDMTLKQQLQNAPSIVALRPGSELPVPLIGTMSPAVLRYCGQFGRDELDGESRKLLYIDAVRWRNQRSKMVECTIVVLSDFVLFIQDDSSAGRATFFAQDGRVCCIPVCNTVARENAAAREQNGVLMVISFPNRDSELYDLTCSSSHNRIRLLEALKNAVLNCPEMPCVDETAEAEKLMESFNKMYDMISKLKEKDDAIQKAVSDKMTLFNSIFEVIHAQLGTSAAYDLSMSKLETTVEATQFAAAIDAANKLHGLLRNSYLLAAAQPAAAGSNSVHLPQNAAQSRLPRPAHGDQSTAALDDNSATDLPDLQTAVRALQTLLQSLPKVVETATRQRTELESARIKLLQTITLNESETGAITQRIPSLRAGDDDRFTMTLPSQGGSRLTVTSGVVQRNATQKQFTPSKQLAELHAKQEELQISKREWDKQRSKEQERLDALEDFFKKERAEIEKERAEVARQMEKLKSEREIFQTQVDLLTSQLPQLAETNITGMTTTPSRSSLNESSASRLSPHSSIHHQRSPSSHSGTSVDVMQPADSLQPQTAANIAMTQHTSANTGAVLQSPPPGVNLVQMAPGSSHSLSRMTSMPPAAGPSVAVASRTNVSHTTSVRVPAGTGTAAKPGNLLTPNLLALSDSSNKKDAKKSTMKSEADAAATAYMPPPASASYTQYSVQPPVIGSAQTKPKRGVLDLGGLGQPNAAMSPPVAQQQPFNPRYGQPLPGPGLMGPKPGPKPDRKPDTLKQDEIFF